MNKNTADRMQFVGRVGNHSTKPSARGVNLLGWGSDECLTPEQQRSAMAARVGQIDTSLQNKAMPRDARAALVAEKIALTERLRAIRPAMKARGVAPFFLDVARERLTRAEFNIWMGEAADRLRRTQQELQEREE